MLRAPGCTGKEESIVNGCQSNAIQRALLRRCFIFALRPASINRRPAGMSSQTDSACPLPQMTRVSLRVNRDSVYSIFQTHTHVLCIHTKGPLVSSATCGGPRSSGTRMEPFPVTIDAKSCCVLDSPVPNTKSTHSKRRRIVHSRCLLLKAIPLAAGTQNTRSYILALNSAWLKIPPLATGTQKHLILHFGSSPAQCIFPGVDLPLICSPLF